MIRWLLSFGITLALPLCAYAEGRCPPGQYPIGGQGVQGCAPIPGAAQPSQSARPSGEWESRWGAIAEDKAPTPGQSLATGAAVSQKTKKAAVQAALDMCRGQGGNRCEIRISYRDQCAAIADPGSEAGTIVGGVSSVSRAPTLQDVRSLALRECSRANSGASCVISYSACSMSEFRRF